MPNQTFDRSPHSIPLGMRELAAPLRTGTSVARFKILQGVWPLVALVALTLSSLAFFSAPNIIGLFHDDGIYAVVAKAISEGNGYRIISLPGEPYQTKYPFLYSYLLSWAWSLDPHFPDVIAAMNFISAVFYFAALLLACVLYVRNSNAGKFDGVLYIFLVGGNASVFSMTSYPFSDIAFMAVCLCCLALSDPTNSFLTRTKVIVLLSVIVGIAFLLRQAGVALILAGLVHFLLSRKRKELYLYAAVVGCFILPWLFWQAMHRSGAIDNPLLSYYQSYESPAFFLPQSNSASAFQIVWDNVRYLVLSVDHLILFLHITPGLRIVIYSLMIWGLLSIIRRQTVLFNVFLLFYSGLILSWPFHPARYAVPLVPILLLSLFNGVQEATAFIRSRTKLAWSAMIVPIVTRIPIAIIVVFTIGWLWSYVQVDRSKYLVLWSGFRTTYGWSGFEETFSWIKQNTKSDDVLATAYDPTYYLYTGRKAVRPWIHRPETYFYPYGNAKPDLGSVEEIREALEKLGVRFLILDPLEGYSENAAVAELLEKLLQSYEVRPELVFKSSDGLHRVYALSRSQPAKHPTRSTTAALRMLQSE